MKSPNFVGKICEAAHAYLRRGFRVVPIPPGLNHPTIDGWPKLLIEDEELSEFFGADSNIGLLLGEPSGIVDVDLDCSEAVAAADILLPVTGMVHGREGNPRSHRYYRTSPIPLTKKFKDCRLPDDEERAMLIELRSTGAQTVAPPSIHVKSGEEIRWKSDGEPADVTGDELLRAVARVAAAALIARYWANGSRHDASLPLAGMLLRAGWTEESTEEFILAVTTAAYDEESRSRIRNVITTARRLASGKPATGAPTLAEIVGEDIVSKVREWLQLGSSGAGTRSGAGLVKELADAILSTESLAQDSGGWLYRCRAAQMLRMHIFVAG